MLPDIARRTAGLSRLGGFGPDARKSHREVPPGATLSPADATPIYRVKRRLTGRGRPAVIKCLSHGRMLKP